MSSGSKKRKSKMTLVFRLSIVALLFVAGYLVKKTYLTSPTDFSGPGRGSVVIVIDPGDSLAKVANRLKDAGVVASVDRFLYLAALNDQSSTIQPGSYELRLEMSSQVVLDGLIGGKNRTENGILIPEGTKASAIILKLSQQTKTPIADFEYEINNPENLGLPLWAQGNVEGLLFPATYDFAEGTSAREMLRQMVSKFLTQIEQIGLEAKAKKMGRTPWDVLKTASLVQAESHPRDFSRVARVVYNRLAIGMMLQFDSTVNYGLGQSPVLLSADQLAIDTKYNTYMHTGLTPTPINNPGYEAISAALKPATGSWIYFVTVDLESKQTRFTDSYARFLEYKNELLNYCANNRSKC